LGLPARFFVGESVGLGGEGGKRLFEANMAKCSAAGIVASLVGWGELAISRPR